MNPLPMSWDFNGELMRHNSEEDMPETVHSPVLRREVLQYIEDSPLQGKGILIDATLGEGGHSELVMERFPELQVIAFERDSSIFEIALQRLKKYEGRLTGINDNFKNMSMHLNDKKAGIAYMLFDFGISSFHYEKSGRGFAYSMNEKLDMRLDANSDLTAAHIINRYREKELADIFYHYGEERWSRRIASLICAERQKAPVETTGDLAGLVLRAIPKRFHVQNIHPATRVFQALRIAVNDELAAIKEALKDAVDFLAPGGRLMAISFHSLEDRIVKERFRALARGCLCENEPKYCQCQNRPFIKILTKKPIMADMEELKTNMRARSAKMRVCEKL